MATATQATFTPVDLLKINDRPMPELVDRRLVERSSGQRVDAIACRIAQLLGNYAAPSDLGLVNGSQCGYQIFRDAPNKVRIPDASFTRKDRLPPAGAAEGHSRTVPDLVVEVISQNDEAAELFLKVGEYLGAGVPLIWVVNPEDSSVQIYHADGTGRRLGPDGMLDGGDVLPGFRCQVSEFFKV